MAEKDDIVLVSWVRIRGSNTPPHPLTMRVRDLPVILKQLDPGDGVLITRPEPGDGG